MATELATPFCAESAENPTEPPASVLYDEAEAGECMGEALELSAMGGAMFEHCICLTVCFLTTAFQNYSELTPKRHYLIEV